MKSAIDGEISSRSAHAWASSAAISSVTSRDQPSAVLKATTQTGDEYWLQLEHRLGKSIRGRDAIADQDEGKVKDWLLTLYPMVMDELALMAGVRPTDLRRDMLPASGPVIVAEHNRLPWIDKVFQTNWRKIARAVGIPDDVQNRDSRAGAATDAERKGADIEKLRQGLGHSRPDTTRIYTRAESEATADIALLRFGRKNGEQG